MPEPIIAATNISKSYRLAHRLPYGTLRESMVNAMTWPWRRWRGEHNTQETFWALRDINFTVQPGERLGIIGRNGAGKSTLLKILSQITSPTTGSITLRGRVNSLLEIGTGFHPELTGRENIFLNGAILGMKQQEIRNKFDDIVAFSEIEQFLDTPVKRYSSGMYVRLAFAVAAHLEPEILIVDEVLAVGDMQFQQKCLGKMDEVGRAGRTVIFVSHNMNAIHRLCNRAMLLDKGKIVHTGHTESVIDSYVSQGFVQRPEYTSLANTSKPIHLRAARLLNHDGKLSSEFRYDQGFRVEIEYEVNRPVKNCVVWFGIRTVEEVHVLGSADTDVQKQLQQIRAPGLYRTQITLPAQWLNAGNYYFAAGIVETTTVTSYDRVEVTGFTILDVGVPESNRPGILQPYLPWETQQI